MRPKVNTRKWRCSIIILNFSHSLTDVQLDQIREMLDYTKDEWWNSVAVRQVRYRPDISSELVPQTKGVVERAGITPTEWKQEEIVVFLPSISALAMLVLVEIRLRCGYYPKVIRIKKKQPITDPPEYVVAEVINLQSYYDRLKRSLQ